jgi:hypothetical protein
MVGQPGRARAPAGLRTSDWTSLELDELLLWLEREMQGVVGVRQITQFPGTKKDGTNGLAVRAGRPVTQLTSSWKWP